MSRKNRVSEKWTALRRGLSLLLVSSLAVGLAACGRGDAGSPSDGQSLSGKVYVPEFVDLDLDYVSDCCAAGDGFYLLGEVEEEGEVTDPITGETTTGTVGRTVILCVPEDGGPVRELENYESLAVPEGKQGYSGARTIQAGPDGTLWVGEYMSYYSLDLPEDFDPDNDDYWAYMTDQVNVECQRQLDATGSEIRRVDTTDLEDRLAPESEDDGSGDGMVMMGYSSDLSYDRAGNAYIITGGRLCVLDGDLQLLFALEAGDSWNDPVLLGDGTVALLTSYSDLITDTYGRQLETVDVETGGWGATYLLPDGVYQVYPGGGDYLFYYVDGDVLYGAKAGEAGEDGKYRTQGEELLDWLEADINSNDMESFAFLPDGRVAVMSQNYDRQRGMSYELALLTATERVELPEKTTLTYGVMSLGYDDRERIVDFNRASDSCRIEVVDYAKYNTDDDPSGGLSRLSTEIVAGKIPDIVATSNMPVSQMAGKGLLEDLWPYIDSDPDLGREDLMGHVFDVASDEEGRLFQIFSTFTIQTVAGAPGIVGDRTGWTLADLQAALATMPEGCTILGETDAAPAVLNAILAQDLDEFVDWDAGSCSFDSDAFKDILRFCAGFPASFDSGNYDYQNADEEPVRISEGRQMLMEQQLSGFESIQLHRAIFGGSVSYVGYPVADGGCGSCFAFGDGLALSSACADKDSAWSFMRQVLLPQHGDLDQDEEYSIGSFGGSGFPTNREDFDFLAKVAMTPQYRKDANGDLILDENGQPIEDSGYGYSYGTSVQVEIMATTQEEYDQIMALYDDIERAFASDQRIFDIVSDVAGSYFAGDTDLDTAAANIQSRVDLYINENR